MGGRQRGKKTLVGIAVKVRGRGSGCLRLQVSATIADECDERMPCHDERQVKRGRMSVRQRPYGWLLRRLPY